MRVPAVRGRHLLAAAALAAAACVVPAGSPLLAADPVDVLTTTTDLRELARIVGGDDVAVTCATKGPEDPHFLQAKPSLIRAAADADLLLIVGRDLEVGYEPLLREQSRNARIQLGAPGHVDASAGLPVLERPEGPVDRSGGDVHPDGNPHYLCDPVLAKTVAATIAKALARIDPDRAEGYTARAEAFAREVDVRMWGEALLAEQPAHRLEERLQRGELLEFLRARGLEDRLGGWAALLAPHAGREVVSYHGLFVYLLHRFHIVEAAKIEPKPGVDPTPRHTLSVIRTMKERKARVVLHASFHPERTARQVAEQADAVVVQLAHMPGASQGTDDYLATVDRNVRALADALRRTAEDAR